MRQLAPMGEIYTWADTMWIWMGEKLPLPPEVVNLFMSQHRRELLSTHGARSHYSRIILWLDLVLFYPHRIWVVLLVRLLRYHRHTGMHTSPDINPEDLETLLDYVWASRLWTFQELLLSSNPVIVFGNTQLPWENLLSTVLDVSSWGERRQIEQFSRTSHWIVLIRTWMALKRPLYWGKRKMRS